MIHPSIVKACCSVLSSCRAPESWIHIFTRRCWFFSFIMKDFLPLLYAGKSVTMLGSFSFLPYPYPFDLHQINWKNTPTKRFYDLPQVRGKKHARTIHRSWEHHTAKPKIEHFPAEQPKTRKTWKPNQTRWEQERFGAWFECRGLAIGGFVFLLAKKQSLGKNRSRSGKLSKQTFIDGVVLSQKNPAFFQRCRPEQFSGTVERPFIWRATGGVQ